MSTEDPVDEVLIKAMKEDRSIGAPNGSVRAALMELARPTPPDNAWMLLGLLSQIRTLELRLSESRATTNESK